MRPSRGRRAALSYIEVLFSIPLVGLVIAGALEGSSGVLRTWSAAHDRQRGLAFAEQLMAEVLQQPYEEPDDSPAFGRETSESGGTRLNWDDIDDYDGWSKSPMHDKENAVLTGTTGWTRAADVAYVSLYDPTQISGSDTGLARITVTVTDPSGQATVLTAYRSRHGSVESVPLADTTTQSFVTHELETGAGVLHGGARAPNHVEDE